MSMNDHHRVIATSIPGQGWDYALQKHPFHEEERLRGAVYCVYNRRLMANAFEDSTPEREYWLLRRTAGALHTGELTTEISGPDAAHLLDKVFTRNIAKTKIGRCSYQFACYPDGGMIVVGVLMRLAEDRFWYVQADGDFYSWLIAHSQGLDVTVRDPKMFVSQVQGPLSMKVLADAADGGMPDPFRYFDITTVSIAGNDVTITRTGYTNELGWEFYLEPHHDEQAIWATIKAAGVPHGMDLAGLDGFEARRIEGGIQNAGSDFDLTMTPYAAGLGGLVDLEKEDFIGKDALMNADKGCRLYGLRCSAGTPAYGGPVYLDDEQIGYMTCGAWSPFLQCGVGYVRLDEVKHGPGTDVTVTCVDGSRHAAVICAMPFYDEDGEIQRGKNTTIPDIPT